MDTIRTLGEIYNLIVEEKATFEDYKEFVARLLTHTINHDELLKKFKEERLK